MNQISRVKDIKTQISILLENDLRTKIVIPSVEALDGKYIHDWHGSNENGIDVYFASPNIFNDLKHCAIVIKTKNISKSGPNDIRTVFNQIDEAIQTQITSPIDKKTSIKIREPILLFNGKINKNAYEYLLSKCQDSKYNSLMIVDIDKLTEEIRKIIKAFLFLDTEYYFNINTFKDFCRKIIVHREKNSIYMTDKNIQITESENDAIAR